MNNMKCVKHYVKVSQTGFVKKLHEKLIIK